MYLTDGETNATLRRGDVVEHLTLERGLELLAGRRAWELANEGAPKKGKRRKKTAPTLTRNTISDSASKKKSRKAATGVGSIK